MRATSGFSVIELLIVVVMLGLISALSVRMLRSDQLAVQQAATILSSQISRARLEAIKNNENAGIWLTAGQTYTGSEGANQGGANYGSGAGSYKICVDANRDNTCGSSETTIHSVEYGTGNLGKVKLISGGSVIFNSRGISVTGPATLVLSNTSGTFTKTISINAQGRASIL
jgi:type IV fimbrial biogenesis protein FimT